MPEQYNRTKPNQTLKTQHNLNTLTNQIKHNQTKLNSTKLYSTNPVKFTKPNQIDQTNQTKLNSTKDLKRFENMIRE